MTYGRLDVFVPDGPIQTFPLAEKTVSVGRSPGNTIALDNNTISRYHFTLTHEDGQVYVTDLDSANGTYLDGVKLPTDERRLLLDGDEILIGNLRIIYHVVDDTPTVKLDALDETTQRVEMALSNFYIDLQGPGQAVAPGAHISAELSITNTASSEERYKIEVSGPPEDWIRIDRPTPLIGAGDTTFVLINFKPLRHSTSTPGDYDVRVRVYPKSQPKDVLEARLTLTVLPFGSFSIQMEKRELVAGERFHLALQNDGSANLPLSLRGQYRSSDLDVRFASSRFVLAPGQRRVVEGEARPGRSVWIGSPKRYSFDVLAQSHDHAAFLIPIRAYLTVKPLLPGWLLAVLAGGLAMAALVVVAALLIILNQPPPQPVISNFTLSSRELARGTVLEVSWQAADVDVMRLLLNGTPVAEEDDPQRVSLNVDTAGLSGEVTVELQAINGEQYDTRSATVLVYEPMTVERFEVRPSQLVRYVVQGLDIDWNVPGAISTRLTGLDDFSTLVLEADGPAASFTDIPGIPTDPLLLRLVAHDAYGNMLESRLPVNVVNPECVPSSDQVRIFVGPDPRHQVVGTVPPTGVVTVDARDRTGGWLRVVGLSGGLSGWAPAAALNCSASFNVSDLRIEPNVPTPPPTPTATPSSTPTLTPTTAPTATIIPSLVPRFTPST
jgi:pSer/pThr/pTyr-binding forkhead associated (FHA) protein